MHSSQGEPAVPADETLPGFHPRDFTCETSNGCIYCSEAKFEARDSSSVSSVILVYFIWPRIRKNKREVFRREWNEEAGRATIFLQTETPTALRVQHCCKCQQIKCDTEGPLPTLCYCSSKLGGKQKLTSSTTELGSVSAAEGWSRKKLVTTFSFPCGTTWAGPGPPARRG